MKSWECGVCGYIHKGEEQPEKCPVCEAPAERFTEVVDKAVSVQEKPAPGVVEKRWKCTVCGYIHTGSEPPEACPVCNAPAKMFLELDENGKEIGSLPVEATELISQEESPPPSLLNFFASQLVRHHLHAISVHFPNGILPVVVALLAISMYFNLPSFETAAFYNSIAVLVALPLVLLTGYLEWQKRYKGIKTAIFITKISCAMVVLASTNVLVFWRILDPGVATADSPVKWIYLGIAGLLLGAAGLAGHLGGKLAFGGRS